MRVLFAVAIIAFGIAGASAADLDIGRGYSALGRRTAPLVVYDYHPGVVVRAYWSAPWRHRHYYPTTGDRPEVGRNEDLSAVSAAPEPPETFQRSWSTSTIAVLPEQPRADARALDAAPDPRADKFSQPPDRAKP